MQKSQAQQLGMVVDRYKGQGSEELSETMQEFWIWVEQWLPHVVTVLATMVKEVVCHVYLTLEQELNLYDCSPHLAANSKSQQ